MVIWMVLALAAGVVRGQGENGRLRIVFGGDIMGHSTLVASGLQTDGSYDFEPCFEYVRDYIESADLAVANLEVTLAGKPYTSYPYFSSPDALALAARNVGFDIVTTANNHCLDKGKAGLERTLAVLDSLGVKHLGTYMDEGAREREHPLMVEKNGIRMALLTYTYGCNGFVASRPNVVNLTDTAVMRKDLEKAHALGADFVVTMMHWGIEYEVRGNGEQVRLAKWLMNNGSDIVIGGHPHVVQNLSADINPLNDRYPEIVVFSMGNLLSNQRDVNTDGGIMVELRLKKDALGTRVERCYYFPYWVNRYTVNKQRYYRIVPARDGMANPKAYGLSKEAQGGLKRFVTNLDRRIEDSRPEKMMEGEGFGWFEERTFYQNGKPKEDARN